MSHADVVRTFYRAVTERDLPSMLETLEPDVAFEPVLGVLYHEHEYRGLAGMTRWYEELGAGWESFSTDVADAIDTGDSVVAFVHLVAHRGDEDLTADIGVECRFRGDRICGLVGRDAWAVAEELGMPGPPAARN